MKQNVQLIEVAHTNWVYCVKLVGKLLVSCGDTTIQIWNVTSSKQLHILNLPSWCYNFDLDSKRTLLAVAHGTGVSIWNFSSLNKIIEMELDNASDVRFDETGTQLIIGQYDGQVTKMDLQ